MRLIDADALKKVCLDHAINSCFTDSDSHLTVHQVLSMIDDMPTVTVSDGDIDDAVTKWLRYIADSHRNKGGNNHERD